MGNLFCVYIHTGNIHDTKGGVYTFEKTLYRYPTLIEVRANQGYRGAFKNTFEIYHNIRLDISPRIQNTFEFQPLRWKVERTLSWFQGFLAVFQKTIRLKLFMLKQGGKSFGFYCIIQFLTLLLLEYMI